MKKYGFIFFSVLLAAVILFGICFFLRKNKEPPASLTNPDRGMFEWREKTLQAPESALVLTQSLNITKWYQELPENWDKKTVSDFSIFMHNQKIEVFALFGAKEWGFENDGATLISHLDKITEYNSTAGRDERIDGVMIDIEPYVTPKWKKNPKRHMKAYVDGMVSAYKSVQGQNLKFIICIPRHYDDQGLSDELERLIAVGCDEVAVMDYDCGNEAEKIKTEAKLAQKYKKELHCILEFQEVGKHGLTEEKTYRNKGLEAAWRAWESVDAAYPMINITWDYHYAKPLLDMIETTDIINSNSAETDK